MEQASVGNARRLHPLLLGAAASVMIVSLVGVAAVTGFIPSASPQKTARTADAAAARQTGAARQPVRPTPVQGTGTCASCGTIESVRAVEVKGDATGVGAVAGGVAGGVVGNQFGKGNGRAAMTVVGAAGGAYAGHEIEKEVKKKTVYRVTVRMDDGSYRTISQPVPPGLNVGERVRIVDGAVVGRG